jgi:hypothetical protein
VAQIGAKVEGGHSYEARLHKQVPRSIKTVPRATGSDSASYDNVR